MAASVTDSEMAEETFSNIGRIEAIRRLYGDTPYKPASLSSFNTGGRASVTTASRAFLEGVDFDLTYFPLRHLGHKCVIAVTGSLYAALSRPQALSVRIGVSAKLDFAHICELWAGIVAAAKEHGYKGVDLDITPSVNGLFISVAGTGEAAASKAKNRPAAQSKDLLCLSGSVGGAYFGFRVLEREKTRFLSSDDPQFAAGLEKHKLMVGDYLHPQLSPSILKDLEEAGMTPSCGCLVDRGLADAVKRLCQDTRLGAKVYADRIPFEGNSFDMGKELGVDTLSVAMSGGEDYRLLFAVPILKAEEFRRDFQTFEIIGHLAQGDVGAVLVTPDGVELPMKAQGWPEEND